MMMMMILSGWKLKFNTLQVDQIQITFLSRLFRTIWNSNFYLAFHYRAIYSWFLFFFLRGVREEKYFFFFLSCSFDLCTCVYPYPFILWKFFISLLLLFMIWIVVVIINDNNNNNIPCLFVCLLSIWTNILSSCWMPNELEYWWSWYSLDLFNVKKFFCLVIDFNHLFQTYIQVFPKTNGKKWKRE